MITHHAIDFGDHLHVGIFDAVVDGLDEMTGAVFAQPSGAGFALNLADIAVSTGSIRRQSASFSPPTMIEGP
jgi:hypothetical protein